MTPKSSSSQPRLINARFLMSLPQWKDKDLPLLPQICFAGRSNVGKSSLINALAGQKNLAKTSSTPGRTQALVVFEAALRNSRGDSPLHIVDLPGYGYAKVPLAIKASWRPMVEGYFRGNTRLLCCFFLIDGRRDPREEELELLEMMEENEVAVVPVVTKVDKLRKTEKGKALRRIAGGLGLEDWHDLRPVSVSTREGLNDLLLDLEALLLPDLEESGEAPPPPSG